MEHRMHSRKEHGNVKTEATAVESWGIIPPLQLLALLAFRLNVTGNPTLSSLAHPPVVPEKECKVWLDTGIHPLGPNESLSVVGIATSKKHPTGFKRQIHF